MIKAKESELLLTEISHTDKLHLPKILASPSGAFTARTTASNATNATTNITKLTPRSTHVHKHKRSVSNMNLASPKFLFPNEHDHSTHVPTLDLRALKSSPQRSTVRKLSRELEPSPTSIHQTSSRKLVGTLSPLKRSLNDKIGSLRLDTTTLSQAISAREGKHLRSTSDITTLLTPRNESKVLDSQIKNYGPDAAVFFKRLYNKIPETAQLGIGTRVTLKHYKRVIREIIFDLNYEKRQFEKNKATKMPHGYRQLTEYDHRVEYFWNQRKILASPKELCEKLITAAQQILNGFSKRNSKAAFDEGMSKLVGLGREYQNSEIALYCLKLWGKITRSRRDMSKAEQIFKQHKQMCNVYRAFENKVSSYKHLGICAQEMLQHKTALSYFIKMLQMSWFVDNPDFELKSYDMIGMQYFYMNCLDKANHYHDRAMSGIIEPKESDMRKVGINRALQKLPPDALDYRLGKKHTEYWDSVTAYTENPNNYVSSDEEFEIQVGSTLPEGKQKSEKHKRVAQIVANMQDLKSGKMLRKVKKEVNIHKIFESALKKDPSANSNMNHPSDIFQKVSMIGESFQDVKNRIFMSHLSPNRGLQNFSKLNMMIASADKQIVEDYFDTRTILKAIYQLDKLIKNLEFVLVTLQRINSNDQKLIFEYEPIDFSVLTRQPKRIQISPEKKK